MTSTASSATRPPPSLLATLRTTVDASARIHEALVELGGERLTYTELWHRAARVAGGLRAGGCREG